MCSIEKENGMPVKHRNEPPNGGISGNRKGQMGRYFWTRELLGALYIVPHQPFPIPVQKLGSAATTLSSSPEKSISISVSYKKVEEPFLLVVGDQE
jgi:hypothetical protein